MPGKLRASLIIKLRILLSARDGAEGAGKASPESGEGRRGQSYLCGAAGSGRGRPPRSGAGSGAIRSWDRTPRRSTTSAGRPTRRSVSRRLRRSSSSGSHSERAGTLSAAPDRTQPENSRVDGLGGLEKIHHEALIHFQVSLVLERIAALVAGGQHPPNCRTQT